MHTIKDDEIVNETISDSSDREMEPMQFTNKEERQEYDLGRWTAREHQLFLEALVKYGNEWKLIQEHIKTRSSAQARSHAQKYFIRLKKEFRDLLDVNVIKQKIHQKFQYELQEHFTPANLNSFLDIMIKLIYINEKNISSYNCVTFSKKKLKTKQTELKSALGKKRKGSEKARTKEMRTKSNERQIFKIERNLNRKHSVDVTNPKPMPKKGRMKRHMARTKKRVPKAKPPCINYFMFNMYDNSTNNYLNPTLKHIQSNTSIGVPMIPFNPQVEDLGDNDFGLETKETKNNPFFIQFEPEEYLKNDQENINADNNFNDFFPF